MRKIIPLNKGWAFTRQADVPPTQMPQTWPLVDLPHTWNALDGQDGGNDYDRGTGYYAKTFPRASLPDACRCYLELQGANATATVYLNGRCLGCHHGGYSTWRVELTPALAAENLLVIAVDNGDSDAVYPQMADFTFYGGLYRAVQLLCVDPIHFTLDDHGGPGLVITPEVQGDTARVHLEAAVTGRHDDCEITFRLYDAAGAVAAETTGSARTATLTLDPVHLWQGKADPYCYRAEATLHCGGKCLDQVSLPFGCRTIAVDPERGFLLNGKPYPLRGVSRPVSYTHLAETVCQLPGDGSILLGVQLTPGQITAGGSDAEDIPCIGLIADAHIRQLAQLPQDPVCLGTAPELLPVIEIAGDAHALGLCGLARLPAGLCHWRAQGRGDAGEVEPAGALQQPGPVKFLRLRLAHGRARPVVQADRRPL